jgi:hypothetical protein
VKEGVEGETRTRGREEEPGAVIEISHGRRNNQKMESSLGKRLTE